MPVMGVGDRKWRASLSVCEYEISDRALLLVHCLLKHTEVREMIVGVDRA